MAQFDVYKNLNKNNNQDIPYLLDIQNDILNNLTSRVIVPLIINEKTTTLTPIFIIENIEVHISTTEITSIPKSILKNKICSLENNRSDIINALDFMITGY